MTDNERDLMLGKIQTVCAELKQSFDTVQVFCTHLEDGQATGNYNYGTGNWFARYGQVVRWLVIEDADVQNDFNHD